LKLLENERKKIHFYGHTGTVIMNVLNSQSRQTFKFHKLSTATKL